MKEEIKQQIESTLGSMSYLTADNIPNIELYMDQVTTLMDKYLSSSKRDTEDKILTKTMINNYAKNNLLPPPNKKKYTKEHVVILIFIYYFKNILSISDIQTLLSSVKENHFQAADGLNMTDIYSSITDMILSAQDDILQDVQKAYDEVSDIFPEVADQDSRDELQLFSFISLLCFDIYRKKQLIETLIDDMTEKTEKSEKPEKK